MAEQPEIRFVADAMLGRLARWLRALGYDTSYDPGWTDAGLVALARQEGRSLLTRDRRMLEEADLDDALLIRSQQPLEQLREVLERFGLDRERVLLTRCLICNDLLDEPPREELEMMMPPSARALAGPIRRCPSCERVYWPGSHVRRMREALRRV